VDLQAEDRPVLEGWAQRRKTAQALAMRARIVLKAADGVSATATALEMKVCQQTVGKWRKRYAERGVDGLLDEPRPGQPRKITDADVERVLTLTLESKPKAATHWSTREMAKASGINQTAISRIWCAFSLAPHRAETFKLSKDPLFIDKVRDIVGLYMNPPERALVLCVDEKSQIQALDRTQPGLPLKKGRCGTMTHDYKRNGTTTLFAAIELLEGKVIGQCYQRHRHQEFLRFLRRLDQEFPANLGLHLVIDNYGTHSHHEVAAWLKQHPRFVLHFVPTSCSWLNLIERWFRELTTKRIRRDSFPSVPDLKAAIEEFLEAWNEKPKPFIWRATVESILAKLSGCRQTLEQLEPGCTLPRKRKLRQPSV
jgi:transposase